MVAGKKYERDLVKLIHKETKWKAQRSAASMGICDVAIYTPYNFYILFEVKSTKYGQIYTSETREQYNDIKKIAKKGYPFLYIVRWKGKKELHGSKKMDKFEIFSPLWSDVFRFSEGISLTDFINVVNESSEVMNINKFVLNKTYINEFME